MSKNAKEQQHLLQASIRLTFNKLFPILQKESQFDLCSIQGVVRSWGLSVEKKGREKARMVKVAKLCHEATQKQHKT